MTERRRSEISRSDALRIGYMAAAAIVEGALREGFIAAEGHGYEEDSVEGRRIQRGLTQILGMLQRRSESAPRRRRIAR
jgi:hypothetical protein